ncbi:MAG: zinc ABC transporter substrate-binding protein [Alphaproteobacteria bacterium]|jgi:zinc transport system substrate-binding protein|nr:zinc ABC transporter substrate-binding protein [Alphaproteobacteria bacterium]
MTARAALRWLRRPAPAAFLAALTITTAVEAAAPKVVVTVPPLHSLTALVMAGRGEPALLLPGGASPHVYVLKPSDARKLARADIVIRVGESLETFLEKPLVGLAAEARVITLADEAGLRRLPVRQGGVWEKADEAAAEHDHHEGGVDPHLWLDPRNAQAIIAIVAAALSRADPEGAETYAQNARAAAERISALESELQARLGPVRERPYVVFHDAYQYFERSFALNAVGAVAVSPERPPGARRLLEIRAKIRADGAACVFSEPQYRPRLVETIVEGTGAKTAVLDPLGAALAPGPEAYFGLMRNLAAALAACLAPSNS